MKDPKIWNVIQAGLKVLNARASAASDDIGLEAGRMQTIAIPEQTGPFPESKFPITAFAAEALKHGTPETQPLLDVLADSLLNLPWKYNYEPREDKPELSGNHMAWGEIIGPEAPFIRNDFCFGFTLIAPNSFYPAHFHPAIELYYVVSGTAEWTLNGKSEWRKPGSFIFHPSNAIHSMRTADEPLLAMYTWGGDDVITLSQYAS